MPVAGHPPHTTVRAGPHTAVQRTAEQAPSRVSLGSRHVGFVTRRSLCRLHLRSSWPNAKAFTTSAISKTSPHPQLAPVWHAGLSSEMTLNTRLADAHTLKALEAAGFGSAPEFQSQLDKLSVHLREPIELVVSFAWPNLGLERL